MKGECRVEAKVECKKWSTKESKKGKCRRQVQKGKCRQTTHTGPKHARWLRPRADPSCKASPHRAGQGLWCWKGFGTEKCDLGNCAPPTPTPHPDTSENVEKQQKTITTTCNNCPKMTSNDPQGRSKRPLGTLRGDPKSMVAKNMIFDELWGAKGTPKGPQTYHFRCQKASKNTPRNC